MWEVVGLLGGGGNECGRWWGFGVEVGMSVGGGGALGWRWVLAVGGWGGGGQCGNCCMLLRSLTHHGDVGQGLRTVDQDEGVVRLVHVSHVPCNTQQQ